MIIIDFLIIQLTHFFAMECSGELGNGYFYLSHTCVPTQCKPRKVLCTLLVEQYVINIKY